MKKNSIIILCYHGISKDNWRFTINPSEFKRQINFLIDHKYNFYTLTDLFLHLNGEKDLQYPAVILNFDDGYKGLLEISDFLYEKRIYPTLFLLGNTKLANRVELDNNLQFLTKQDIAKLEQRGWEIGSHSLTHSNLSLMTVDDVEKEVRESKLVLEKTLKNEIYYFSYPRGKYDENVIKRVMNSGYRLAVTMDDDIITKSFNHLFKIPRIGVDNSHSFGEFRTIFSPSSIMFRKIIKSTFLGKYL